jgi:hypothetical protein
MNNIGNKTTARKDLLNTKKKINYYDWSFRAFSPTFKRSECRKNNGFV